MIGYVYILVNSAFPNLVKIGRTSKDSFSRADELSSTGSPSKFIVAYDQLVSDSITVESLLHEYFNKHRYSKNREFFELNSKAAIDKMIEISSQFECESSLPLIQHSFDYFEEPTVNHFLYLAQIGFNHQKDVFYRIGALCDESNTLSEEFLKQVKAKLEKFFRLNKFGNYYEHEVKFLKLEKIELANTKFQKMSQEIIKDSLDELIKEDSDGAFFDRWRNLDFDRQSLVFRDFEKSLHGVESFYSSVFKAISKVREESVEIRILNEEKLKTLTSMKLIDEMGNNF